MLHTYIVKSVEAKTVQLALGMLQVLQAYSFIIVFETLGKNISTYQIFAFTHPLANHLQNDILKISLSLLGGFGNSVVCPVPYLQVLGFA